MNLRVLIVLIAVFIVSISNLSSQVQTFDLSIECEDQVVGNSKCIKFKAGSIDDLTGLQFTVAYDPSILKISGGPDVGVVTSNSCLKNITPSIFFEISPGLLNFVWSDDAFTITNDCELFTICFDFIGPPGSTTTVSINSLGTEIEATSEIGLVQVNVLDCVVDVLPNGREIVTQQCSPTANGVSDGKLCFYGIGGVAPYNYAVKDALGNIIFNGILNDKEKKCFDQMAKGSYTISIMDNAGIAFTPKTVQLMDIGTNPSFTILKKDPSCFNKADGTLVLKNIFTATNDKKIQWSTGKFNVDSIDYLRNGKYTVSVTDGNGCTTVDDIEIKADTLKLDLQILLQGTCLGLNDAGLKLTGSGGTSFPDGTYSFALTSSTYVKANLNPFDWKNAPSGWVTVKMQDNAVNFNGIVAPCKVEKRIFVPYRDSLKITDFVVEDILCKGKELGKVSFQLSGTGTSYSLPMQKIAGTNTTINPTFTSQGSSNIFFNNELKAGSYFVIAKSNAGCSDTINFQIKEPPSAFVINAAVVQPSCTGLGSIKINTSGGVFPISIKWEDGSTVNEKTNLLPGTYIVTVSDFIKCDSVLTIKLEPSGNAVADAVIQKAITCKDANNGEVTVTNGNGSVITYLWKDKNGKSYPNTKTLTSLPSGTYFVTVTVDGCIATDSVFLANPDGLSIASVEIMSPECPKGGLKGSIGLNITGGASPYKFEWQKQGSNSIIGNLSVLPNIEAGTYTVKIIDQAGCTKDTTIILQSPNAFKIDVKNLIDASCNNLEDGKANAKASLGPVNNGKYTFFWSNGQKSSGLFDMDNNLTLKAGKNWVFVVDAKCISDTVFFTIGGPPPIVATAQSSGLCAGGCEGQIEVQTSGGSAPPLVVSWPTLNETGNVVYNLCVGSYPFQVKDGNGCILKDTVLISISDTIQLLLNDQLTEPISCRKSIGQIVVDAFGGLAPYKYNWIGSTSTTNIAKDLSDGTYSVTVTDAKGCTATLSYIMSRPSVIIAEFDEPIPPRCFGGTSCIKVLNVTGGTGNYTMQINNGLRIPIDSCFQLFPGKQLVSIYDGSGCKSDYTVTIPQTLPLSVSLGEDINLVLGDSIDEIEPIINSEFQIVNFNWAGIGNLKCLDVDCSSISGVPNTDLTIQLIVTDENGCTGEDELIVNVSEERNVFLPNIFKLNSSDEKNKRFDIAIGSGVKIVEQFVVFDRWGNIVHQNFNYIPDFTTGWDGMLGSQAALPGVYTFRAKVVFIDGASKVYFGDAMLLK
jgi:hypothetical protein